MMSYTLGFPLIINNEFSNQDNIWKTDDEVYKKMKEKNICIYSPYFQLCK